MRTSFAETKIKRMINYNGQTFVFLRNAKGKFGEVDETIPKAEITIKGLYHEKSSYVTLSETEGSRLASKPIPMILVLFKDYEASPICLDDMVVFNGVTYKVTGSTNIQQGNYGVDISLEVYE